MSLKVGIIGAGIGGLCAAIALRRTGAHVEIYEKSHFQNEVGAAITITPNGMRALDRWGFDTKDAGAVEAKQLRMCDDQTLRDRFVESFRNVEKDYGARFMFFHRVDLHTALRKMAVSENGQSGVPVAIRNGKSVTSVDCYAGRFTLEDGEEVEKDLIVIADGVRTRFISNITGQDQPLEHVGFSFYRCLIPVNEINKDAELKAVWDRQDPGFWVPFDLATGFFLVSYPCRDKSMMNIALKHKTRDKDQDATSWNTETSLADIVDLVKGRNPLLERLLQKTSSMSVHKVERRDVLDQYTKGRAVIIGDAAHPIQPTHAQGAVMAIEEATALEVLFSGVTAASQVPKRMSMYNALMKKRLNTAHLLSDATPGVLDDKYREQAKALWEGDIYPHTAMNFSKPIRDFFYLYDVHTEAKAFLAEHAI
ncbi:unnamed protein product [Clonostachys byssicola]|uniref:FAD-binding domain-containing protein n=1 Tax=Clonostachys byssicola TaxID=160290 RepID=A0A9N9XYU2_9HYPO|nr:unnamed protein product [Clonostachys byssicola]